MGNKRGFGNMSPERQKAIASKGGKAAHKEGVAHKFTPDEARQAGRIGGNKIAVNREYMRELGRRGGKKKTENQMKKKEDPNAQTK